MNRPLGRFGTNLLTSVCVPLIVTVNTKQPETSRILVLTFVILTDVTLRVKNKRRQVGKGRLDFFVANMEMTMCTF